MSVLIKSISLRGTLNDIHNICHHGEMITIYLNVHLIYIIHKSAEIRYVPASILHKSRAGRYRPDRVADGPITARCRFIKNASWGITSINHQVYQSDIGEISNPRREIFYEATTMS